MRYLLLALFAVALAGCQPGKTTDLPAAPSAEPDSARVIDMNTNRIALDWAGIYEGLLA